MKSAPLAFVLIFVVGLSFSLAASDFESWNFIGVETKIKNAELVIHNANFFRHDYGYFLNHTQITYDVFTHKTWFLGLGYKQEYVKFPQRWRKEYRPFFRLFYQKQAGNWHFIDKSQYELRFIDGELIHRYRNQIIVLFKKYKGVTPIFTTEFFINTNNFNYNRQRIFAGAFIPVSHFKIMLFTGPEINKFPSGNWKSKYILGAGINYSF
jgi:hypothetical protein